MLSVKRYLILSISVLLAACGGTGKPVNNKGLRFALREGRTYAYAMEIEGETNFNGAKNSQLMKFSYEVDVLDAGTTSKLSARYKRAYMKMSQPAVEMDTDDPSSDTIKDIRRGANGISKLFRATMNKDFLLKVSRTGEIKEVGELEEMKQATLDAMNLDKKMREVAALAFSSQFNEHNLRQAFEQAFHIYPDREVKPGDSWEIKTTLGGMLNMEKISTYRVKEASGDKLVLELNASWGNKNKMVETGTITLDAATGLVIDANIESRNASAITRTRITGRELNK